PMKTKLTISAFAVVCAFGTVPAHAQTMDEMRQELKKLRNELDELKKPKAPEAKPADAAGLGDRIDATEIKSNESVVLGDITGGFPLPGIDTWLHIYSCTEAHVP